MGNCPCFQHLCAKVHPLTRLPTSRPASEYRLFQEISIGQHARVDEIARAVITCQDLGNGKVQCTWLSGEIFGEFVVPNNDPYGAQLRKQVKAHVERCALVRAEEDQPFYKTDIKEPITSVAVSSDVCAVVSGGACTIYTTDNTGRYEFTQKLGTAKTPALSNDANVLLLDTSIYRRGVDGQFELLQDLAGISAPPGPSPFSIKPTMPAMSPDGRVMLTSLGRILKVETRDGPYAQIQDLLTDPTVQSQTFREVGQTLAASHLAVGINGNVIVMSPLVLGAPSTPPPRSEARSKRLYVYRYFGCSVPYRLVQQIDGVCPWQNPTLSLDASTLLCRFAVAPNISTYQVGADGAFNRSQDLTARLEECRLQDEIIAASHDGRVVALSARGRSQDVRIILRGDDVQTFPVEAQPLALSSDAHVLAAAWDDVIRIYHWS